MSTLNSFAWFDILATLKHVRIVLSSMAQEEFHLLAYFACLLSIYKGRSVSEWGYGFAATRRGAPYSPVLDDILERLTLESYISKNNSWYFLTDRGSKEYEDLLQFSEYSERDVLFEAVGSLLRLSPIGITRKAVSRDPLMKSAAQGTGKHLLLEEESVISLNMAFNQIRDVLSEVPNDLLVPATVWVEYFSQH